MKRIIGKIIKIIFIVLIFLLIFFVLYFLIGKPKPVSKIKWGINFSQIHAQKLGLSWKETYKALLDDLGAKEIRIASYWNLLEPEKGKYFFDDLDWQIKEAEKRKVGIILAIGMKTPRWPEYHIPEWVQGLEKKELEKSLFLLIEKIVQRYKDNPVIWAWQVENEPFFRFGEGDKISKDFLDKEIALVRNLDFGKRKIIISESGENSFWIKAAERADIVGITMYKKVWNKELKMYFSLPYPSVFYWRKAELIKKIFDKKVICVELQAEPWTPHLIYNDSLEEQKKTMNLTQFRKNIDFAKRTGLDAFYLWGGEWWYWLKKEKNEPDIWNEAKKLFESGN